ncbi:hypothetical protein D3C84_823800 [compost metagenome]
MIESASQLRQLSVQFGESGLKLLLATRQLIETGRHIRKLRYDGALTGCRLVQSCLQLANAISQCFQPGSKRRLAVRCLA